MNRLFSFVSKGESHLIIRFAAKVVRVLSFIAAFFMSIYLIILGNLSSPNFFLFLFLVMIAIICFFLNLLFGIFLESMLLGFSNIVENQYEELVLKNKAEDIIETGLSRKENANFEKLKKLNELKESGAITEAEFEGKKKSLIEKI